jgi:DMSO/TMAO reductase YedYZ molybdopterin-dependent catalytic subunit
MNGFPLRLVVPGWYVAYWVKHDIEVLAEPHDNVTVYRAPVAAKDVDGIVNYLGALRSVR